MPRWDELAMHDEVAQLLADLDAARSLLTELPADSRDRALVVATIDHLTARLLELVALDTGARGHGAPGMSRGEVPNMTASNDGQNRDVVRRLADWRAAEQATQTAEHAAEQAMRAATAADRAAQLAVRVAGRAKQMLELAGTNSEQASEAAETLLRDADAASEEAGRATEAAAAARRESEAAKAAFRVAQGKAFDRVRE